jgi:hypothetical protein
VQNELYRSTPTGSIRGAPTSTIASASSENTRSGAIDSACEFTAELIPALEAAAGHPDITEELAEVLSTSMVELEYRVESGVHVNP